MDSPTGLLLPRSELIYIHRAITFEYRDDNLPALRAIKVDESHSRERDRLRSLAIRKLSIDDIRTNAMIFGFHLGIYDRMEAPYHATSRMYGFRWAYIRVRASMMPARLNCSRLNGGWYVSGGE